MYNSGLMLAMPRIILELLLIFTLGGVLISTAEKEIRSPTEKSFVTKTEVFTQDTNELVTSSNFTPSTKDHYASNAYLKNGSLDDDYKTNEINNSEADSTNVSASTSYTDGNEIHMVNSSNVNSSDIDYGGNKNNHTENEIEGKEPTESFSKAELYKGSDDLIILAAESPDTTTDRKKADFDVSSNFYVENTSSVETGDIFKDTSFTYAPSTPAKSDISTTNSVQSSSLVFTTTINNEDETNAVEVTSSNSPASVHQRVSASPKSATKKRSLNDTSSETSSGDYISTTPHMPVIEISASSMFSEAETTEESESNSRVEDLPSPLPLEAQSSTDKDIGVGSTDQSFAEVTTFDKQSENNMKVIAVSQAISPQTISLLKPQTEHANILMETKENDYEREELSTVVPEKENLEVKHEQADKLTSMNNATFLKETNVALKNHLSPHESDDIIFANFADDEPLGVTFDPDGMKNNLPQDPDSIIFSVSPVKSDSKDKEKYIDVSNSNANKEMTGSETFDHEHLTHEDLPSNITVGDFRNNSLFINNSNDRDSSVSESVIQPEIVFSSSILDDSEEMLQDSPHFSLDNHTNIPAQAKDALEKERNLSNDKKSENQKLSNDMLTITENPNVKYVNEFISNPTQQSTIRPNTVTSPPSGSVPSISKSQSTEASAAFVANLSTLNVDQFTSSPAIFSFTNFTKILSNLEVSTVQSELAELMYNKNITENVSETALELESNSTIAGIAVKTSVSVSLPVSKQINGSGENQNISSNLSLAPIHIVNPPSTLIFNEDTVTPLLDASLNTTTSTPSPTTSKIKIRKPNIRVPGASNSATLGTRKPFMSSLTKPTTTAGPSVSIFKKSRTRANSITSSTTARPFPKFSTIRIHYASHLPGMKMGGEMLISTEPITTTEPPTTTTEEPISEVPFTDQTFVPSLSSEDDVTLIKVGGGIVLKQGMRWIDQLGNRQSPEFKENAKQIHLHLERLFRSSPIASRLWRIEIDGFNGTKNSRGVEVDFILYLIKSPDKIPVEHLTAVFHEKLNTNYTFARYRVDPSRTAFELLQEEPLNKPTPPPEDDQYEPPVPQWAIAVIVVCAASLIFVILFAALTMYGRHHMRRRYGNKLSEDDMDRSSGDWESKMTAAYENMAADTIYDAEDLRGEAYKKSRIATFHGIPTTLKRCDSWSSGGWSTPPRRKKPTPTTK